MTISPGRCIRRSLACVPLMLCFGQVDSARPPGATAHESPVIHSVSPDSGPVEGGTAITISGSGLMGATSVKVRGAAATNVVVVNDTTIQAITPAGEAGAAHVQVTTPGGTGTLGQGFQYGSRITWYTVLEHKPDPAVIFDEGLRSAITSTGLPWRVRDNGTGIEMVLIPPGSFKMGEVGRGEPVHRVKLTKPFYLGRHEVTQALWSAKMGSNPSFFVAANGYPGSDARPVEQVSWNDITAFGSVTGLRLPTEAEWEYAYRAGTVTGFHGSPAHPGGVNDERHLTKIAWFGINNTPYGTKATGSLAANGFGVHDMAGNVWEWVGDWHGPYAAGDQSDPTGPETGTERVLRGGVWNANSNDCRAATRMAHPPGSRYPFIGFRAARSP